MDRGIYLGPSASVAQIMELGKTSLVNFKTFKESANDSKQFMVGDVGRS